MMSHRYLKSTTSSAEPSPLLDKRKNTPENGDGTQGIDGPRKMIVPSTMGSFDVHLSFLQGCSQTHIYIWDAGMPRSPEQMAEGSKVWTCCKTKEKSHPFDEIQQTSRGNFKAEMGIVSFVKGAETLFFCVKLNHGTQKCRSWKLEGDFSSGCFSGFYVNFCVSKVFVQLIKWTMASVWRILLFDICDFGGIFGVGGFIHEFCLPQKLPCCSPRKLDSFDWMRRMVIWSNCWKIRCSLILYHLSWGFFDCLGHLVAGYFWAEKWRQHEI